jgi:ankyrin repeat protein
MEQLLIAAEHGDIEQLRFLIDEEGADINIKDHDGFTALLNVALIGHNNCLRFLLDKGANVNSKDNNGYTALHIVAEEGFIEIFVYY